MNIIDTGKEVIITTSDNTTRYTFPYVMTDGERRWRFMSQDASAIQETLNDQGGVVEKVGMNIGQFQHWVGVLKFMGYC